MAACRHTSAKAAGSLSELGERGLWVAASRSHRRGPGWQPRESKDGSGHRRRA